MIGCKGFYCGCKGCCRGYGSLDFGDAVSFNISCAATTLPPLTLTLPPLSRLQVLLLLLVEEEF